MKQNRNVSCLNQNKTKLNYVIKFSLIECSLFITNGICLTNVDLLVQDIKSFLLFYAVKRKRDFQLEMYVMAEGVLNSTDVSCFLSLLQLLRKLTGTIPSFHLFCLNTPKWCLQYCSLN